MRFGLAFVLSIVVVGCSSQPLTSTCPTISHIGAAPTCTLTAQCIGANTGVKLDCSKNDGTCVCSMNGIEGKTVDYQNAFCDPGTSNDDSLGAANDACGWKL
jgi:hypothetical protein